MVGVMLPLLSMAHGYWLEIEGSGKVGEPMKVKVFFGEIDDNHVRHKEADSALFTLMVFKGDKSEGTPLKLKQEKDCWVATFTPAKEGVYRFWASRKELPVVDRSATGGKNVKPTETLYAVYQVGKGEEKTSLPKRPFIYVKEEGELTRIFATNKNQPVPAGTKIRVFHPDNTDQFLTTDAKGAAVFTPVQEGLYIIRFDYVEPTPGSFQGVPYVEVRNRCNYSYYKKK